MLSYFSSVGSSSKPSHHYLPLSLGARHIQEYIKRKSGRKQRFINQYQEKARREKHRKEMRLTVQAKLVVGFWKLIPMESGYENSEEQDTTTVTKELE